MQLKLKFLNDLKIQYKLWLIPVVMALPILYTVKAYYSEKTSFIEFAQKEQLGADYLVPLKGVARNMARHRGLTNAMMRGSAAAQSPRAEAGAAVDKDLAAVTEIDQKPAPGYAGSYGVVMEATSRLNAIQQKWGSLKSRNSNNAQETYREHTQLIGEVIDLMRQVGDKSNLILDPDLDTYYLMDLALITMPLMLERVGEIRGIGTGVAAAKAITPEERGYLLALNQQLEGDLSTFRRDFETAIANNADGSLKDPYAGKVDVQAREVRDFIGMVNAKLLSTSEINIDSMQFFNGGTQVVERLKQMDELALGDLHRLLGARINKLSGERTTALVFIALGIALAALAAFFITRGVNQQTASITKLIAEVEKGNFDHRITVESKDELGLTAKAFNDMLDNTKGLMQSRDERDRIQTSIMKLLDEVSNVADGDLTVQAEVTEDMTGAIADAFNYMIVNLRDLIGKVQSVSNQVTQTTGDTAMNAERLAQGSQEQAERITQTSVALNEMSAQIVRVSQSADSSAQVADQSLQTARKGSEAVQNTMEGMTRIQEQVQETARRIRQLGERSQEIEEIVRLIEEIADRTGVLALNASIQAAAAGEAGHGFGVVASEVEHLAGRSAEATKRISSLIRAIQSGTNEAIMAMEEVKKEVVNGARIANTAGQSLHEIETVSNQLASLVRSISLATQQQARGSEALSQTMSQLAQLTNQTTSGVMQSALTVKNLAALADDLRASVSTFKVSEHDEMGMSGSSGSMQDASMANAAGRSRR